MRTFTIDRSLRSACTMVLLMGVTAFADPAPTPGNPESNASDRNYDTNQPNSIPGGVQKAKDGANRGMNHVDRGLHKAGRKVKRGAHNAKRKTNNAVDSMTEPAIKPAQ